MAAILFLGFLVLLLIGVPVTMSIGLSVLGALFAAGYETTLYIIPLQILEGVNNSSLLAIPFFVLAGNLMNSAGVTDRIFNLASALVGHFRAGLAQVNVMASVLFGGISGASVADVAGLGTIEIKAMRDHGYPAPYAAALTAASAIIGGIVPPSIMLVIYAYLSGTSVARLFLSGVVPGLVMALCLMIFNYVLALKSGFPRERRRSFPEIRQAAVEGIPALAAPAIIMGAILTGFTTATEAGVLACLYVLALSLAYRKLTFRVMWDALADTVSITTVIMIIIGFSHIMGWLLAIEMLPQQLAEYAFSLTSDPAVFLILLVVFLLVIGCFVEGIPAVLILVPIFLPLVDQYGIDRVHFGVIITMALLIGLVTPPMGIALYIAAEVGKVPFEKVAMAIAPLMIPLIVALLLVTFVPPLVSFLPDLVLGPD